MEHLEEPLRHFRHSYVFCHKCKSNVSIASGQPTELNEHITQCFRDQDCPMKKVLFHDGMFKIHLNEFRLTFTMVLFGGRPFKDEECLGCESHEVHKNGGCAEGSIDTRAAYRDATLPIVQKMNEHYAQYLGNKCKWLGTKRQETYDNTFDAVYRGRCDLKDDNEDVERPKNQMDIQALENAERVLLDDFVGEQKKYLKEHNNYYNEWVAWLIREDYRELNTAGDKVRTTDYGKQLTTRCTQPQCDADVMKEIRSRSVEELQKLMRECIEQNNITQEEATNSIFSYLDAVGEDVDTVLDLFMKTPFGKIRFIHNGAFDDRRIETLLLKVQELPTLQDRLLNVRRFEEELRPRFNDYGYYLSCFSNSCRSLRLRGKYRKGCHGEAKHAIITAIRAQDYSGLKRGIREFEETFQSERVIIAHLFAMMFNLQNLKTYQESIPMISYMEEATGEYAFIRKAAQRELRKTFESRWKEIVEDCADFKEAWKGVEHSDSYDFKKIGWLFKLFVKHDMETYKEFYCNQHLQIFRCTSDQEADFPEMKADLDIFGSVSFESTLHAYQFLNPAVRIRAEE